MLMRIWCNSNSQPLLAEMQNSTFTLEDNLVVSYKTHHIVTIWSSNHVSWFSPKWTQNSCPHKTAQCCSSSFIHNCQSLEATMMPFGRWMYKVWCIQTMEYCSVLKENELSGHEKMRWNAKYISLSERSQSEKTTYCVITTVGHSGNKRGFLGQ